MSALLLAALCHAAAPELPEGSVLTPTFALTGGITWSSGEGFVAATPRGPLVFSVLHAFGPSAGLRYQLDGGAVARDARMSAKDVQTGKKVVGVARAIGLAYTEVDLADPALDVVAFAPSLDKRGRAGGPVPPTPLPLSDTCPERGAELWVPGNALDAAQGIRSLPVEVATCDGRTLDVRFKLPGVDGTGLGGAPVVDGSGRVYGMLAIWDDRDDGAHGLGPTAAALLAHAAGVRLPTGAPPVPPPPPPSPWGTLDTGWAAIPNPWGYDLPGLHAKLLPTWGLSGQADAELRNWLGSGPFGATFAEVSRLSWADNMGNFVRIDELVSGWNSAYREAGVPIRMYLAGRGQTLAWMSWYRYSTVHVQLGRQRVAADVVARMDGINVADAVPVLLEHDPGVVVPVEELRDAQLYAVWGRLDPAKKDPLAPALRAELEVALGADTLGVLERTAPNRRGLDAVHRSVRARSSCSGFGIAVPSWRGLSADTHATLESIVGSGRCARITADELARLDKAYAALAAEPRLEAALSALLGHLARSLAVEAAGMRAACDDGCGWAARVAPGVAAALADTPTRAAAVARLCTRAEVDTTLDKLFDGWGACSGRAVDRAAAAAWPSAWGDRAVAVDGTIPTLPVQWPRDP